MKDDSAEFKEIFHIHVVALIYLSLVGMAGLTLNWVALLKAIRVSMNIVILTIVIIVRYNLMFCLLASKIF